MPATERRVTPNDDSACRLFVVRHGQSTWNADGRWQGRADPPLSELGARQAEDVVSVLHRRFGTQLPVSGIWASPLMRAHQTADIIGRGLGLDLDFDARLQEVDAGEWTGLTRAEIEAGWPGYLAEYRRPPGFESHEDLVARSLEVLGEIAAEAIGKVLVITHGGVIGAVERHLGATWERTPNLGGRELVVSLGGLDLGDRFLLIDPDDVEVTTPRQI
jgi:broad specificity phosphatase PhoE